jgi:hypothetical protein
MVYMIFDPLLPAGEDNISGGHGKYHWGVDAQRDIPTVFALCSSKFCGDDTLRA